MVGFLFLTEKVPWTNTSLVGHPEFKTYKGREVLVTSRTINAFGDWMEKNFFPSSLSMTMLLLCSGIKTISTPFKINFILKNYSLISKDLWSSLPGPPEDKSQVIGLSWTPGICNSSRYSIVEETCAIASIVVSYKYNR